jgi:FtsH-binding integral membrane protein
MRDVSTVRIPASTSDATPERATAFLLSLYLNFINLFLILLRFQGGRRGQ